MAQRCVLEIRPIEEAPIKEGEIFGPCALSPGINGRDWTVGEFDGNGWFNLTGENRLHPRYFASLPSLIALAAAFSGSAP